MNLLKFNINIALLLFGTTLFGQSPLPVLKANAADLSIRDGNEFRPNYWSVSPDIELDVYQVDKTSETKKITYYSDMDSISFEIGPGDQYDFMVVLNEKDTCFQRVESGITFQRTPDMIYTADTIPFILAEANNILVQAIVNQLDTVNLMLHSAAGSYVSFIEDATAKMTTLNFDKKYEGAKSWGGSSGSFRVSDNNTMQIGKFKWNGLQMSEGKLSGHGTDGKFGINLFDNKVVEIRFDEHIIIVHSFLPDIESGYEKCNLICKQDFLFLEGTSTLGEEELKNEFLIHTGYSGAVLFDDKFASENSMSDKLEVTDGKELKDSQGNVLKTKKGFVPDFKIGDIQMEEVPVSFFEGAIGRQKMSVIGTKILKKFNVIFDLQNAHLYMRPNSFFEIAFSE